MHPHTNKEFDSKLYIQKIKHTTPFGMPGTLVHLYLARDRLLKSAALS
jgi:uncharacterized protein YfeS